MSRIGCVKTLYRYLTKLPKTKYARFYSYKLIRKECNNLEVILVVKKAKIEYVIKSSVFVHYSYAKNYNGLVYQTKNSQIIITKDRDNIQVLVYKNARFVVNIQKKSSMNFKELVIWAFAENSL